MQLEKKETFINGAKWNLPFIVFRHPYPPTSQETGETLEQTKTPFCKMLQNEDEADGGGFVPTPKREEIQDSSEDYDKKVIF